MWAFRCNGKGGPFKRATSGKSLAKVILDRRIRRRAGNYQGIKTTFLAVLNEFNKPIDTWKRLHSDADDPKLFREWLKLTLDSRRKFDFYRDYGYSNVSSFSGLLTYLYLSLYCDDVSGLYQRGHLETLAALSSFDRIHNILDSTIRTENLAEDLISSLHCVNYELGPENLRFIRQAGRTNVSSRRRKLTFYYDDETTRLILEKEAFIIEKYAYPDHAS